MASRTKTKGKLASQTTNPKITSKEKSLKIGALFLVAIGIVVLTYPFIPYLQYQFFPPFLEQTTENTNQTTLKQGGLLSYLPLAGARTANAEENSLTGNRLIIPKIGVYSSIVEGPNDNALLRGSWRIPNSSTPAAGGNTVITGHRFRFRPPNNTTFYLLDKLTVGDEIKVVWNEKEYQYQVSETKIVDPSEAEATANTEDPTLTLYTCTPLFTTQQRLVVIAKPI